MLCHFSTTRACSFAGKSRILIQSVDFFFGLALVSAAVAGLSVGAGFGFLFALAVCWIHGMLVVTDRVGWKDEDATAAADDDDDEEAANM